MNFHWQKVCPWLAAIATASAVAGAQPSLPFYEPFDYASGNLVGNTRAGGTWTRTGSNSLAPIQVTSGSLSFSGLPASLGGKVVLGNGTNYEDAGFDVAGIVSGTVYASFVLRVVNAGNTTGDYIFHFSSSGIGALDFRARVMVRRASTTSKYQVGLVNLSAGTPVWASVENDIGAEVLIVVAYSFGPSANDDMTYLWVNPPLGSATPPAEDALTPVLQDLGTLGRVGWRQGSGNSSLVVEVDELRVATSWSEVTPATSGVAGWELY